MNAYEMSNKIREWGKDGCKVEGFQKLMEDVVGFAYAARKTETSEADAKNLSGEVVKFLKTDDHEKSESRIKTMIGYATGSLREYQDTLRRAYRTIDILAEQLREELDD